MRRNNKICFDWRTDSKQNKSRIKTQFLSRTKKVPVMVQYTLTIYSRHNNRRIVISHNTCRRVAAHSLLLSSFLYLLTLQYILSGVPFENGIALTRKNVGDGEWDTFAESWIP